MSIENRVRLLVEAGTLIELPSLYTGSETARTMLVSRTVFDAVEPPFPANQSGIRLAEFRNWLDSAFSEGGEISVAEDPKLKPQDAMLARVLPVESEFWSIRVTDPAQTPGIRGFGAFVGKDYFVTLTWDYRENISDFSDEITNVQQEWRKLFGDERPHSGVSLDAYLSNFIPV